MSQRDNEDKELELTNDANDGALKLLTKINEKLQQAHALNGGFDTLMLKVDTIEKSTERVATQVDGLHQAIYDPDQGLFARIKAVEAAKSENVADIDKQLAELNAWRDYEHKQMDRFVADETEHREKVSEALKKIDEFSVWKARLSSIYNWTIVTLAGAGVGLLGKLLYTVISRYIG